MAKSKASTTSERKEAALVEMTLMIVPRGNSVVHGTILQEGEMRQFKHTLSDQEKSRFAELALDIAYIYVG